MNENTSSEIDFGRRGPTPPTREGVRARAREIARLAGRAPPTVSQVDYEQAKRELTGERELDRQEAMLESALPEKPWDPSPGSVSPPSLDRN